jgi:hypothetical protein
MKRRQNDIEAFVRLAVKKGANALMRERGFKRPGGGWTFYRPHQLGVTARPLTDELWVSTNWPRGDLGELWLSPSVAVTGVLTLRNEKATLPLDVEGDAGDLAVSINHWLRTETLPWFEEAIDVEALARDAEHRLSTFWSADAVGRCAVLWELAGRPEDARRLREHGEELAPF